MAKSDKFTPIDATQTPRFADVATFMRTVRHPISDEIDIGLCGATDTCPTVPLQLHVPLDKCPTVPLQ
ncbi:MAG: hypothetical protein AAGF81_15850, partial [Pseudomonadota bacterium]